MIFTGVTGGEIVSLLYPLFILSPFCYIIISKESLDGCLISIFGKMECRKIGLNRAFLGLFQSKYTYFSEIYIEIFVKK